MTKMSHLGEQAAGRHPTLHWSCNRTFKMRLVHTVCLTATHGLSLTPAFTFGEDEPLIENQPNPDLEIAPHVTDAKIDAASKTPEIIKLLRERVKYVFVIFQENRAFDQMFGTFPGAHGLFSQSESQTPGFAQPILDTDGNYITIQPFRVGQAEDAWDLDDMSHSHSLHRRDIIPKGVLG